MLKTLANNKFLVTGGTGFIGAALVRRLVAAGCNVSVLDNCFRSSKQKLADLLPAVNLIIGDIRDSQVVSAAVKGVDTVIHLAAINGTENFYNNPELVLDVGVRGMLNVLDACREHQVRDLIVASSSEVYQSPEVIPTDEQVPLIIPDVLNPRYSYGGSKIISELLALHYARSSFDRVAIFRPHNVYGADMGWEHVIPQFIVRALELAKDYATGQKLAFPIQGDGNETRAFIHIDDFIAGLMTIIEHGQHLNIYHIGNPEEVAVKEVASKIVNYLGFDAEIQPGALQQGSTIRRCPNIQKIAALGFKPKISLDVGLPSVIDWYVEQIKNKNCL